jgi:spermidine synthase
MGKQTETGLYGMNRFFLFTKILLTGAIILGLELAASRIMTPFFGVSLNVWSSILGITLIALAFGYKFGGVLALQLGRERTLLFYLSAGALSSLWVSFCTWTYPFLFQPFASFHLVAGSIMACIYLLLVPLIVLSALNPLLVSLLTGAEEREGDHGAGHVFFVSTVGSVLGVFAVAYGLLPYLTNYQTIVLLAVILSLLSIAGLAMLRGSGDSLYKPALALSVAAFLISAGTLATGGLERFTQEFRQGEGTWRLAHAVPSFFGNIQIADIFNGEGRQVTRVLMTEGMTQNRFDTPGVSATLYTYAVERLALGAVKEPKKALVLGIGAGVIPAAFVRAGMAVEAVDINRNIVDVARGYLGFDPGAMTINIEDARTAVRHCQKDNDIVVVDLFREDGMPEHLVTREFYLDIEHCLREGGVMVMNTFMNTVSPQAEYALIKTISSVFGEIVFVPAQPRPGNDFTNAFLLARKSADGLAGRIEISLAGLPPPMEEGMRAALGRIETIRPGDARLEGVPVLSDVSNQWKHLAFADEMGYRAMIAKALPWQVLLN